MITHEDDEDGPILYRDDDGSDEEAEDRLAAKLARKDSLALKLSQRPDRQELIERNILRNVSDEERRIDRTAIGAKLIRRLSLRPSAEELEDRNILKSKALILLYLVIHACIAGQKIKKSPGKKTCEIKQIQIFFS